MDNEGQKEIWRERLSEAAILKGVPEHIIEPLVDYIVDHRRPGGFLEQVLSNNLRDALGQADYINRFRLYEIVNFLYNDAPGNCWGSPEAYRAWIREEVL